MANPDDIIDIVTDIEDTTERNEKRDAIYAEVIALLEQERKILKMGSYHPLQPGSTDYDPEINKQYRLVEYSPAKGGKVALMFTRTFEDGKETIHSLARPEVSDVIPELAKSIEEIISKYIPRPKSVPQIKA